MPLMILCVVLSLAEMASAYPVGLTARNDRVNDIANEWTQTTAGPLEWTFRLAPKKNARFLVGHPPPKVPWSLTSKR